MGDARDPRVGDADPHPLLSVLADGIRLELTEKVKWLSPRRVPNPGIRRRLRSEGGMFDPSPIHIILLLVIVLMIFGTKKLPEVGRSVGRGIRKFRGSVTGRDTDASAQPSPRGGRVPRSPRASWRQTRGSSARAKIWRPLNRRRRSRRPRPQS